MRLRILFIVGLREQIDSQAFEKYLNADWMID